MRPEISAKSRFETLKNKVKGDWFKMAKLKTALDKEIAEATGKAAKLRVDGNRYMADAELYQNDMAVFAEAMKGEPVSESYEAEIKVQMNATADGRSEALEHLKSQKHRLWVRNRNDGQKRLQAAGEWEKLAKNLLSEFAKLEEEVLSYA